MLAALSYDPLIPSALWLTLALAGIALISWYGLRRPPVLSRRLWIIVLLSAGFGLACVLFVLLNPTWVQPLAAPAGLPRLTVLVDASASMAATDGPGGRSRYLAAVDLARRCVEDMKSEFEIRLASFADVVTPTTLDSLNDKVPQANVTDLATAITSSLDDEASAGQALLIISDGIHNAGGGANRVLDAARVAKAAAAPIYTRTLGGNVAVQDVALEPRTPQELAFVGQSISLSVLVRQRGLAGRKVNVGVTYDGKEIERREVTLPTNETPADVAFAVKQAKPGLYRYEFRAEPLPGEVSRSNNAGTVLLRVVDRPVRVLLLEGKPYWDAKFLGRTLLADPAIELESVVRLSDNRYVHRTVRRENSADGGDPSETWTVDADVAKVLTDLAKLNAYQVIVLGRDADAFLTEAALTQLRTWLAREGGSLVCYRGQPTAQINQRLGQLLPVRWAPARESRFRMATTDRGKDVRWLPGESVEEPLRLPTLSIAARAEQPKPLAVILATTRGGVSGVDEPALTYQPYGSGRVVVVEGAGMWRWSFLPAQRQEQDDAYRLLWHGLLRWLVLGSDLQPGQKLALRGDKVAFGLGEPATATLLVREEAATAAVPMIELKGDTIDMPRSLRPSAIGEEPGVFRVNFGPLPEGRYQARVVGPAGDDPTVQTAFDVRNDSDERLDLEARPDLMARIAKESGGMPIEGVDARAALRQLQDHRERNKPRRVERLAAWDRVWVLAGILGLWAFTWGRRRASGLV